MKRHGNLYKDIIKRDNIELAFRKARKGKSWQNTIKKFENDYDKNITHIQNVLERKQFKSSEYKIKEIYEPKYRTIYILPFNPDRIVQHALMNIIEPIWDNLFYFHSYACRKGKGQHKGSRKCMEYVRKYDYCLKMDISKFYPSINKEILMNIIKQKIKCRSTINLLSEIINSTNGTTNVPIGNYTSQWFGNLYLNELDKFIKHSLKIKPYIRYCDDFCIFSNYSYELNTCRNKIVKYLNKNLQLSLSKYSIFPVSQGVDFLGYRHFRNKILLRKSTAKRVKRRMKLIPDLYKQGKISKSYIISTIASTEGWLKWANTHNFKESLNLNNLKEL